MKRSIVGIFIVSVFSIGCGQDTGKNQDKNVGAAVNNNASCTYSYLEDSTQIQWTSFKFMDKAPVKGEFMDFAITGNSVAASIEEVVLANVIKIGVAGVNTNNPPRDEKLRSYFFEKMLHTEFIEGRVTEMKDGSGKMLIKMNNIEKEVDFNYTATPASQLEIITSININDWNAQEALNSLNEACADLHTGTDGIKKLWPDVDILITIRFTKNCE